MRRFRFVFVLFSVTLLALAALLVDRALRSVTLERTLRHQELAERVFDEMERGLSRLLDGEQQRPVEQYSQNVMDAQPFASFVVGHFEIGPDGVVHSFPAGAASAQRRERDDASAEKKLAAVSEIERLVGSTATATHGAANARSAAETQVPGTTLPLGTAAAPPLADKPGGVRAKLGAKDEVTAFEALRSLNKGVQERLQRQETAQYAAAAEPTDERAAADVFDAVRSQGDIPPMNGRIVDRGHLVLSRTAIRETRAYRQGVLLDLDRLGVWLREQGLGSDGLASYASVTFTTPLVVTPAASAAAPFVYQHRFAEPFADLTARLVLRPLPGVGSVTYVYALCALLLATAVLGLAALYRMVSVVVSFAERRNNFVAAVSHELKTPLTAIRMYGEMLRDGMVLSDGKRDEYYRHITVESERLSRLINNVLEFSLLEKGTRQVALVAGSVEPVVREVAELLRPHVEGEGFELRLEVDADLPAVRFERDALMQVLWNLVDNAVKYARDASPKRIVLRVWRDGGGVHIAVRDHGPGVPVRLLGKIFEPFYRGENELTRRNKGTGLGLALVRGLGERMGARVSGHNVSQGGFEVEIVFRLNRGAVEDQASRQRDR